GGLRRAAGFEDRTGHQAPAAPGGTIRAASASAGRRNSVGAGARDSARAPQRRGFLARGGLTGNFERSAAVILRITRDPSATCWRIASSFSARRASAFRCTGLG